MRQDMRIGQRDPGSIPGALRARRAWSATLVPLATAACVVLLGVGFLAASTALESRSGKAAIVDQLSLTYASPAFVQNATNVLKRAGYAVDYYPAEQTSIEFYRQLPNLGYRLLILRVHTPRLKEADGTLGDEVAMVTGDAYDSQKPVSDELAPYLVRVYALTDWPLKEMYGVTDGFVQTLMEGHFEGSTVILTGCSGLRTEKLAKAFVSKGAKEVIGWDGEVAPVFTDRATELLLQSLLIDKLPAKAAVAKVMEEKGADPYYGGRLLSFP